MSIEDVRSSNKMGKGFLGFDNVPVFGRRFGHSISRDASVHRINIQREGGPAEDPNELTGETSGQ